MKTCLLKLTGGCRLCSSTIALFQDDCPIAILWIEYFIAIFNLDKLYEINEE